MYACTHQPRSNLYLLTKKNNVTKYYYIIIKTKYCQCFIKNIWSNLLSWSSFCVIKISCTSTRVLAVRNLCISCQIYTPLWNLHKRFSKYMHVNWLFVKLKAMGFVRSIDSYEVDVQWVVMHLYRGRYQWLGGILCASSLPIIDLPRPLLLIQTRHTIWLRPEMLIIPLT